jgi:ABC-type multidrug transport system fused ATPase/permease subunit
LARLTQLMLSARLGARQSLVEAFALEALVIAMGVAGPYALKLLIDMLADPSGSLLYLFVTVMLFVGCWAGASILETARLSCTAKMVDALARHFIIRALAAALPEITAARDSRSGRVPGMLERLPYSLTLVVEGLIWRLGPVILQALASLVVIAGLIRPRYVLILALTLLGFLAATWLGARRHRIHAEATNAAASHVSRTIGDIVRNARRVVLNGALDRELLHTGAALGAKRHAAAGMYRSLTLMAALQFCVVGLGLVALLLLAALDVGRGRMSAGDFVLLQTYAFRLTVPLSSLGYILAQAGVAIANIRDVLNFATIDAENSALSPGLTASSDLVAENVSFHY